MMNQFDGTQSRNAEADIDEETMARSKTSSATQVVYINSKPFSLTYDVVDLGKVRLDPDNPRLRRRVHEKFNDQVPTQEQLRDIVLELAPVPELQADIRESKGLLEPIYVTADGLVVEGNCRTAVFLKLRDTFKNDAHWKRIPVLRFPSTVKPKELAVFQAKYHITSGKNPWEPYEKANHIYHMHTELKMSIKEISEALHPRMQQETVRRNLETYQAFTAEHLNRRDNPGGNGTAKRGTSKSKSARKPKPNKEARRKPDEGKSSEPSARAWSAYDEFFKKTNLAEFRKTPANQKWFAKIVKSGRLGRAENVRHLAKILATPGARDALEKEGIDAAIKIVERYDPTAGSPLFKTLAQAVEALGKFEQSQLAELRRELKQQKIIRALHSKLTSLAEAADIELDDK